MSGPNEAELDAMLGDLLGVSERRADRAFLARPFAYNVNEQLACVDDVSWFSPCALRGFADEAYVTAFAQQFI